MCKLTRFSVVAPMWEGDWRLGRSSARPTLHYLNGVKVRRKMTSAQGAELY